MPLLFAGGPQAPPRSPLSLSESALDARLGKAGARLSCLSGLRAPSRGFAARASPRSLGSASRPALPAVQGPMLHDGNVLVPVCFALADRSRSHSTRLD